MEDYTSESSIELLDALTAEDIQEQTRTLSDMPAVAWTQSPPGTLPGSHHVHLGRSAVIALTFDPMQSSSIPAADLRRFIGPSSTVGDRADGDFLVQHSQPLMAQRSTKQHTPCLDTTVACDTLSVALIDVLETVVVHDDIARPETVPRIMVSGGIPPEPTTHVTDTACIGQHLDAQFPADIEVITDGISVLSDGSVGLLINEPVAAPLTNSAPDTDRGLSTTHGGTYQGILKWRTEVRGVHHFI